MGAVALAAGLALGATAPASAAPSSAASTSYELVEVAPDSVYSVVGPLVEVDGLIFFPGTSPASPTGSWLFSFDPSTGAVGPVAATADLGALNALSAADGMVFFLSLATGENVLHVYDPATGTAWAYDWPAGQSALTDQLAVLGGDLYFGIQGDGLLSSAPVAGPAAASGIAPTVTTPAPMCLDGTTAPTGVPDGLRAVGGVLYYVQYCGDVLGDQLFRRASPTAVEAVGFPAPPSANELVSPYGVLEHGGRTYFAAGPFAGEQHLYSFDSGDLAQPLADLGGLNPGNSTVFRGAVTWFMTEGDDRLLLRSDDGLTSTVIGSASDSDLDAEQGLAAWGDVLLMNGFRTITPDVPVGTRANYLYDAADRSLARIGPDGAIAPPFVAEDGSAYVTAFAADGADPDSQHLYRVVRRALPDTGAGAGAGASAWMLVAAGAAALGAALIARARRRRTA